MIAEKGFKLKADPSRLKWTAYSIASQPGSTELEFVYTVKQTGGFTQYLAEHLKVGESLLFKGPCGKFFLEGSSKGKVFVATGAGIAPLMSMIRFLLSRGSVPVRLFYGFRTGEHFLYRKELEKLEKNPRFTMHTTISREDASWKGSRGYVQKLLEKASFNPAEEEVYVCGSPGMVEEVRKLLIGKGFPKNSIKTEQW